MSSPCLTQTYAYLHAIRVRCWKAPDDTRPESYKIDSDSIEVVRWLDPKRESDRYQRREIVLPTLSPSFCHILRDTENGRSLGTFRPCKVDFSWKKSISKNEAEREACYAQLSFFDRQKNAIEEIPFDFYYHFRCAGIGDCPRHKLSIIDWEIGQAYRDWRHRYRQEDLLLAKIRQRWLTLMCAETNDTCFYVGNMVRFRSQFMVLGVFCPKK